MKKWNITINATDEKSAAKMLKKLINAFNTANDIEQPLNFCCFDTDVKKESLKCVLK